MDKSTPFSSLTELSNAVASGDVGPVELTESYLSRIEALDGKLNAFRMTTPERALDEARAAESMLAKGQTLGPLHGLPYAAKDLYDVAGLPTSAGAKILEGAIAQQDCDTVRQLRQRGMVLLGKTNTVQFAYGGVGINHDHGTPHNPWNETPCAPGGSSSGSGRSRCGHGSHGTRHGHGRVRAYSPRRFAEFLGSRRPLVESVGPACIRCLGAWTAWALWPA